jgi:hypothetical protein
MKLAKFTVEQPKALPPCAIVAFAARCARRVEQLTQLPEGHPQREKRREAIEAALRMADSFAGESRRSGPGWPLGRLRAEAVRVFLDPKWPSRGVPLWTGSSPS